MQRPILSGMVAMSGLVLLTFLRMDERCQQASARKEELAKKVQGAVSLLRGALNEGKIVSNNVKRRHLNSGQRAMAVAMMYQRQGMVAVAKPVQVLPQNLIFLRTASQWPAPCCAPCRSMNSNATCGARTVRKSTLQATIHQTKRISKINSMPFVRRANHFRFPEIVSSHGIKNIPLLFSPKSPLYPRRLILSTRGVS
jgi:hypothetical protein